MDVLYKIIGVQAIGERVCLTLAHIKEGKELNPTKILGNLGGFMENMKQEAISSRNPDQVSITVDEYKKGFYSLGNMISISINTGEKNNG
jgi:hypothetical protein